MIPNDNLSRVASPIQLFSAQHTRQSAAILTAVDIVHGSGHSVSSTAIDLMESRERGEIISRDERIALIVTAAQLRAMLAERQDA